MLTKNILSRVLPRLKRNLTHQNKFSTVHKRVWRTETTNDEILHKLVNTVKNPDWTFIRKEILSYDVIRPPSLDAVLMNYCIKTEKFNLGVDYFNYLISQNIKPNLATIAHYFKLFYCKKYKDSISSEEEALITEMYKKLRREYPILDSISLENAIMGLSVTKDWQQSIQLLDEIKKFDVPSSGAYSSIIATAFKENEKEIAYKMFEEMIDKERPPHDIIFLEFIKRIININKQEKSNVKLVEEFQELLMFCQSRNVIFTETVAKEIMRLANEFKMKKSYLKVDKRGICSNCRTKLETLELTDNDFNKLKQLVIDGVIIGKDVFRKTTPHELNRFKDFVKNMPQYDVVIDGLNVTYSIGTRQSPKVYSTLLASVVKHFVEQNKKILVLGREHMLKLPRSDMNFVENNASLFLTQDISQDDPYLLYCALQSGKNTIIVTKDLMRGHKFLLREPYYKMLFARWLTQRQYQLAHVDSTGKVFFKYPPPYTRVAQLEKNRWHIPYDPDVKNKLEIPTTWLCISF